MGRRSIALGLVLIVAFIALNALAAPTRASPVIGCSTGNVTTANTTLEVQACYQAPMSVNTSYDIDVNVTNVGTVSETTTLELTANDSRVETETVTVPPGESRTFTFAVRFNEPGTRHFSITGIDPFTVSIVECAGVCPPSETATDPDDDGLYEDVNGDGMATFADAVDFAFEDFDTLSADAFDFDGDGDVDFDDAVELAFEVPVYNTSPDNPFSRPLPGTNAARPPTDPDDDGLYEDIDGDDRLSFDDIATCGDADHERINRTFGSEEIAALDFDGDGNFTENDCIALAFPD